ncbi:hypothetical protein TUM22923_05910 [Polynucleobacter sp. TUM22923]|jgi:hypothetical protein|uniref:hypothetical protein n=1 Tax=Polynucleobacter sp. TUM22923 TaxID=3022126 RepID=UPI0025723F12|nr:hypothetical protein [Polynucleobacter sp. TUM22923]BDX21270.1 hypothetical protein TUM22923_05910 [Polynucleobacter sp. TUM22923]
MTIKQLNASYLAPDDRILFRFNTIENTEFRFWLTRRVTLFILAATQHLITKSLEQTHSPQAAKAIAEFGKASIQTDIGSKDGLTVEAYQPAENYPLGADPLLVMDAKCTLEKQGLEEGLSLDLVLPGGANINLKLSNPVLQAMCILLNQMREHAVWGDVPQVLETAADNDLAADAADAADLIENPSEVNKPSVH